MKQLISVILCIAMLAITATQVFAEESYDFITAENVMSFRTDKESYHPGETVTITSRMESIWGDPTIEGVIPGYEKSLPGAYGMEQINASVVFDKEYFKAKDVPRLVEDSTIRNIEYAFDMTTNPIESNKFGFMFAAISAGYEHYGTKEEYVTLNGYGDLFEYYLTVKPGTPAGTYRFYVGPYISLDPEYNSHPELFVPEFEFFGEKYGRITSADSFLNESPVDYGAGAGKENIAYIEITVDGDHTLSDEIKEFPPTCTEYGYTGSPCTKCGEYFEIEKTQEPTGHTLSPDSQIITVDPTCTKNGQKVYLCNVCNNPARVESQPALGHDLAEYTIEVSCTEDGYTVFRCDRGSCDYESEKENVQAKLDHKNPDGTDAFGDVFTAVKPTTSTAGYTARKCNLCGDVRTEKEIPVLDIMNGDCNMDGKISIADASVLLKHMSDWDDLYFSPENADVTHNGELEISDCLKILQYIANWDVDLAK